MTLTHCEITGFLCINVPSCENSRSISFTLIVEALVGARQALGDLKAIPFVLQASRITDAANALFLKSLCSAFLSKRALAG
jgi:hypothetical protein